MQLDIATIARGTDSTYPFTSQIVINTQEQWQQVWQGHTSKQSPVPLPPINFDCEQVIAVFTSEKPTTGYAVEIVSVETRTTKQSNYPLLVLKIRYSQPTSAVQIMTTRPYHIIKVPRVDAIEVAVEQA